MNEDFYKQTERAFSEYYRTTIEELKTGHPQYGEIARDAVINIQSDFMTGEIKRRNVYFDFSKLTEAQRAVYFKALVQQIYYVLTEYDFSAFSGYDVTTNSFASAAEMRARAFSPAAKVTLEAAGLFYPGLGRYFSHRRY